MTRHVFLTSGMSQLSRRDFLKLSGTGLLSTLFLLNSNQGNASAFSTEAEGPLPIIGRVAKRWEKIFREPSFSATPVREMKMDEIFPIKRSVVGGPEPTHNRIWYEIEEGYVHSGTMQPVEEQLNPAVLSIPKSGRLVQVTVPFTPAYSNPYLRNAVTYRLYYGTTYWAVESIQSKDGSTWYKIPDDNFGKIYYADATHLHVFEDDELSPLSTDVPENEKRIEVRLQEQIVVCYEGDQPVYITRASTGARFSDGNYATPRGEYFTYRKRPSRHMSNRENAAAWSVYDLPGIPWVSYITENGISFHGTYWHNDFGKPHSHGCVNLPTQSAMWIYRWCNPHVPYGKDIWIGNGTSVKVL